MSDCGHMSFSATCEMNRFEDTGRFSVDVRIHCINCGEQFRFLGVPAGISWTEPRVSIDGLELRAPIEPQGVPQIASQATFEMPKIPEKA